MKLEELKKIAIIGAGNMGNQIAEILSRVGNYEVIMVDIDENALNKGIQVISDRLERFFITPGKLTAEDKKNIMGRIKTTINTEEALKDADFVIEAAMENLTIKKDLFKKLDELAPQNVILASNTSYQNISEMAMVTNRPDKVVGMHFFNPPALMRLVEVVRGGRTSNETVELVCDLARKLEKEPVVCKDASYGFLANRAYTAIQKECLELVWERAGSPADIDKALKLGYNLPMGPIELGDRVGSWPMWAASEQDAMRELGPEKGKLHPLIRMMLRAGYNSIYEYWEDILSKQ